MIGKKNTGRFRIMFVIWVILAGLPGNKILEYAQPR